MVGPKAESQRQERAPLRGHARGMRTRSTDADRKFWWQVRDRRLKGCKFKRQYLIVPYIADFVCLERWLVVELDGGQHDQLEAYDAQRTAYLTSRGFYVLRFWNKDVLTNIEGVIEGVLIALDRPPAPSP